jgi:hypothetical protein
MCLVSIARGTHAAGWASGALLVLTRLVALALMPGHLLCLQLGTPGAAGALPSRCMCSRLGCLAYSSCVWAMYSCSLKASPHGVVGCTAAGLRRGI